MPTWGELVEELGHAKLPSGAPDFDGVRRRYVAQLHDLTGRDTILYATDWMSGGQPGTSIVLEDMQGFMETVRRLRSRRLDLILHSPGGDPDATSSIVRYLRMRFDHIRVFVPLAAMSAATMLSLAADEIWMGEHSQLGPIDPQMVIGQALHPARAIIQQFEQAKAEITDDPSALAAWLPILQGYGPALLRECANAEDLSRRLVRAWLRQWMLKDQPNRSTRAARIAEYFANYERHQSHGAAISRVDARAKGVTVMDLESDPDLQDAVLTVHHATMHTLAGTGAVKLIENHLGRSFVKVTQVMQVAVPFAVPPGAMPMAMPGPGLPPAAS